MLWNLDAVSINTYRGQMIQLMAFPAYETFRSGPIEIEILHPTERSVRVSRNEL